MYMNIEITVYFCIFAKKKTTGTYKWIKISYLTFIFVIFLQKSFYWNNWM